MKTYAVSPDLAGFSRKRSLWRVLFLGGLFAGLQMLIDLLWPALKTSSNLLGEFISAAIGGVIFGSLFVFVFIKRNLNYQIFVHDDRIVAVHPWFQRSVRKGEVKTVAETGGSLLYAPGLRISEYGWFGTRLWGFVWIPKALSEYESLKESASSWKCRQG